MNEDTFGRYRLIGLIGQGGMGKVFRAFDPVLQREVAIKVLPSDRAEEPNFRERFRRETITTAGLADPHVIPVFDSGERDGQLYLVMAVIDGVDLQTLLNRDGPMNPQRAVQVIEQVAAALDTAHAVGLVHRDVKPSNVLITRRDHVYLIDFGIAHDSSATQLTRTGGFVGTVAYMAPERFSAGKIDARGDVYSLACVLHECLTGRPPYPGDTLEQQITAHLTQAPPRPSVQRPGVPAGFDGVVARGMAKNPGQRYRTANELAAAARAALHPLARAVAGDTRNASGPKPTAAAPPRITEPVTVHWSNPPAQLPVPAPRRRRLPILVGFLVVAVLAVAAVGGGIAYRTLTKRDGTPAARPPTTATATIPAGPATTVTATIPVGRPVSGVAVDPGTDTVYTANPDDGTVSVIDPASRTVTATIPVGRNPDGIAVDPGTHTVYTAHPDDGTVSMIDPASRTVTATIPVGRTAGEVAVDSGTHTVYAANFADSTVSVIDPTSRTVTATIPVGRNPDGIAVDPGTHTVYVTNSSDGTVSVIDAASRTVTATIPVGQNPARLALDPDTHTVYVTDFTDRTVSVIDAASRTVTATITIGKIPFGVAVDPDNHTVYVTNYNEVTVSVIDAGSRTVTATITIGKTPFEIAVDPDTHTVYISNGGDGTVSVLEPPHQP